MNEINCATCGHQNTVHPGGLNNLTACLSCRCVQFVKCFHVDSTYLLHTVPPVWRCQNCGATFPRDPNAASFPPKPPEPENIIVKSGVEKSFASPTCMACEAFQHVAESAMARATQAETKAQRWETEAHRLVAASAAYERTLYDRIAMLENIVKDAPHAGDCDTMLRGLHPCDCWKATAREKDDANG